MHISTQVKIRLWYNKYMCVHLQLRVICNRNEMLELGKNCFWKNTVAMVLFGCSSCLFATETPSVCIHKSVRPYCIPAIVCH